jgi:hypothetical protein
MTEEAAKINCPTFRKQEPVIQDITAKINSAKAVQAKAAFAEELQEEVGVLLSCPDYDQANQECENCRFVANLRNKTAALIAKAKKLGQSGG